MKRALLALALIFLPSVALAEDATTTTPTTTNSTYTWPQNPCPWC